MQAKTDVCLVLEGTYPYVSGGVSSWVHRLITSLKEITFSLAIILPDADSFTEYKYDLPPNIREVQEIYLHDMKLPEGSSHKLPKDAWQKLEAFHTCPVHAEKFSAFKDSFHNFFNLETRGISPAKIADSKEAWRILTKLYQENAPEESFIDYFWTFRFMHIPLFKVLSAELPVAKVYHALSTGYAGLLATVAKLKYNRPIILTEHGIYTRERRFEISRVDWIYEKEDNKMKVQRSQNSFKELWNSMFSTLSKICYDHSDTIITLFEGNQSYQLAEGATPERMRVIPNGVDYETFSQIKRHEQKEPGHLVIGYMGRVVSIKDVKTFIRACRAVANQVPDMKAYIMGPTDEEPGYYQECVMLVEFFGLKNIVEFTGKIDVKDYYPKLDIVVLTSISEAQPLVILEAHSMGIPVVATDVGACSELLFGRTEDDKALGKSGLIAGITNSDEVAEAIVEIWNAPDLMQEMGEAGKQRVRKYYNRIDLDDTYRELYKQHINGEAAWQESALS